MTKKYRTVSLPAGLSEDIEELMEELGYWPSVGSFVREATVKMVREYKKKEPDARNRGVTG
jgi:Arc/MetJ-type ribon-helix-helix transcriptional regulator